MHSLKPTGLPPDRSRSWAMNSSSPIGLSKALWRAGETQSTPIGTPRVAAISARDLGGRQDAAVPGLRALAELDLDHLHLRGLAACSAKRSGSKRPLRIAAAEVAAADFPDQIATEFAVIGTDAALAGVVRKATQAARHD